MNAIEKELQKATGVKPKKGEPRSKYLDRLSDEADKLDDPDFEKLSEGAQKWVSDASAEADKAKNAGRDALIYDFDEEVEEPKTKSTAKPEKDAEPEAGDAGEPNEDDEAVATKKKGKAAPKKAAAKETKAAKPAKSAKTNGASAEGYKGHRAGSRKEQAHKMFDELGAEKARPKAEKLGVKASTISAWFSSWNSKKGSKAASK